MSNVSHLRSGISRCKPGSSDNKLSCSINYETTSPYVIHHAFSLFILRQSIGPFSNDLLKYRFISVPLLYFPATARCQQSTGRRVRWGGRKQLLVIIIPTSLSYYLDLTRTRIWTWHKVGTHQWQLFSLSWKLSPSYHSSYRYMRRCYLSSLMG